VPRNIAPPGERWHQRLIRSLLDFLYPQSCVICGSPQPGICLACRRNLPFIAPPLCDVCGRPYAGVVAKEVPLVCGECRTRKRHFDHCRSALFYKDGVAQAVKAAKYRGRPVVAHALGEVVWHHFTVAPPPFPWREVDAVIPVPLHPSRQAERGFNQAQEIVTPLCQRLRLPLRPELLARDKNIAPQVGLNAKQRRENVRWAFAVRDKDAVKGASLLLFDDVMTTGATLEECARVLKRAGAAHVWALTAARQLSDF